MIASGFDRLTRLIVGKQPRRVVLTAVVSLLTTRADRALAQVTGVTCGGEGDACTMLLGCCAGLTCVSSALNPAYGVCATGDGGMITVGTSLLVPGSEAAAEQAAAMVTEVESAAPVDLQAERQAQLQERRAKQDEQLTRRRSKQDQRQFQQRRRRDNRRSRASSESASASTSAQTVEVGVDCPQGGVPQLVTIRNAGPATIDIEKVSSLLNPIDEEPFTPTTLTIDSGITQQLQFGGVDGQVPGAIWFIDQPIFESSPSEGVRVELRTEEVYLACCDGTARCYGGETAIVADADQRRGRRRRKRRRRRSGTD